jgi:hypothetical protein
MVCSSHFLGNIYLLITAKGLKIPYPFGNITFLCFFTAERSRELRTTGTELSLQLNDAIQELSDLHLKHRRLTEKHHEERYLNARSKAEQKRLKGIFA